MELIIRSVKYAPGDKSDQIPLRITLLREIPGPDRPDYWLGALQQPFHWESEADGPFEISHLVIAAQWDGTGVQPGITRLPVGVAYVVDSSLLEDDELDLDKIRYVAHGVADDPSAENPVESLVARMTGAITAMFGKKA